MSMTYDEEVTEDVKRHLQRVAEYTALVCAVYYESDLPSKMKASGVLEDSEVSVPQFLGKLAENLYDLCGHAWSAGWRDYEEDIAAVVGLSIGSWVDNGFPLCAPHAIEIKDATE